VNTIEGIVFDIEGVLVTSGQPIDGAVDAMKQLGSYRRAFLTNTTSQTRDDIAAQLTDCGFDVEPDEVLTAARLTAAYLRANHPGARCWLLNSGDVEADFEGTELTDEKNPDVVVIGGAGDEFTHLALSRVVEPMLDGVPAIAMHRGRTWASSDGLRLDVGGYLPGLEEAGNASILTIGKPSSHAFETAAASMGLEAAAVLMIGDDIHSDVQPAQAIGMTGVLVKTGKFRESVAREADPPADYVIDSVADLPALLRRD
jgi:HAD superfamily hydrolase (TIGR01458 family)